MPSSYPYTQHPIKPVAITSPTGGFGELITADLEPRLQVDAVYGVDTSDVQTFEASGGQATASDGLFTCSTGTTDGAYAVIRSKRVIRYRPGQASLYRFAAKFTAGVANSLQAAGAFNSCDGLFVCYYGAEFGVMLRQPGRNSIQRLTITGAAAGAETITVTLNDVDFTFATGGALTTAQLAELVAEQSTDPYTGWTGTQAQHTGTAVTFVQDTPATTAGAFTFASTGAATGTFAEIQEGSANTMTEASGAFVPQASWNIDVMDGSKSPDNPSGMSMGVGEDIDPTKLTVYAIQQTYLGAGAITFYVMTPDGVWIPVHRFERSGIASVPSNRNPTLRVGWIAASLGSTTALEVAGASAAAFIEGDDFEQIRNPFCVDASATATTTETTALVIRVRSEYGNTVNQRELVPIRFAVGSETASRLVRARLYLNPTLAGNITYAQQSGTSVDVSTTATTRTGGQLLASILVGGSTGRDVLMRDDDIRIGPGDVLAITLQTSTATSASTASISWAEN